MNKVDRFSAASLNIKLSRQGAAVVYEYRPTPNHDFMGVKLFFDLRKAFGSLGYQIIENIMCNAIHGLHWRV